MNFLQLVNKVMRRVREPVVGSVDENTYSLLIGEFVNDAKRMVEDAWAWRALVDSCTVTTVAGTSTYDLEDFNCVLSGAPPRENARLYIEPESSTALVRINTDNQEAQLTVQHPAYQFVDRIRMANDAATDKPDTVIFGTNPTHTSGLTNLSVSLYPIPDDAYSVSIFLVNPQNDLEEDTDVLLVPSFPVIQLAYLYALYERGEEIGEALTLTSEKATAALADAIMFDSSQTSNLVFTPD